MLKELNDQVILVTGASTGLGKALALRLSQEKARIILNAHNADKLQAVAGEILQNGGLCSCFAGDVTDITQNQHIVEYVMEAYGKIDILINIAGIWHEGQTESHPKEKIMDMFKVNCVGVIYLTQELLPIMKKQHKGHIFNVVSIAGVEPAANWGIYTATKYAVSGFTESLKLELAGSGIKVSGFYPGGMNTDLFTASGFPRENEPWMMDKNDVAEIITFILKQPDDVAMDHVEVRKFLK
jgi:NADP-dependent 3-hydroxy acid dehydrogenase YdfG